MDIDIEIGENSRHHIGNQLMSRFKPEAPVSCLSGVTTDLCNLQREREVTGILG